MLTRGDRQTLSRLSAAVERSVTIAHELGLKLRGRNKRIAERVGVTDRSVRRHAVTARTAGVHMPVAVPGRPPRTDYTGSRRGHRRRRGDRRAPMDPWMRAASFVARPGDDLGELVRVMRVIHGRWRSDPFMTEREAAIALRKFLDGGGRLGPEAWRYWSDEVRRLPLDAAHTPWRAAASPRHVAPFVAHRRALERADVRRRSQEARSDRWDSERAEAPPDILEELRAKERRLRGPP